MATSPTWEALCLEFAELPKTISGKIRHVELRGRETTLHAHAGARPEGEYRDEDFPSCTPRAAEQPPELGQLLKGTVTNAAVYTQQAAPR